MGTRRSSTRSRSARTYWPRPGPWARPAAVSVRTDVLVADHPEQAIVDRATEAGADLLVMASARKPTTHRAFFGHRIDYVISHAKCPVAVVAASSTNGTKK
ncbi:MAG TPA: universal stress protein [Acidimicrobiales bacterium]|nr:universal stress protein [Acidimicrobiales bacterium]